jgi:ubiquinone/menaquinone biosynthesis C-methylase UbiE
MKRIVVEELLDLPGQPPAEIASCLDDLRSINRRMGGNALHADLLRRASEGHPKNQPLHLLEVASGRADVLQHAALALQAEGRPVRITLLDQKVAHFPELLDQTGLSNQSGPSQWDPRLPKPECVTGDALAMPFAPDSVDIVSCCLFVHHLEPEEVSAFLQAALRVARRAVIINDLERSRLHWLLAQAGSIKFRSRFTVHDAPVSVRRAYTLAEMRQMLEQTGHRFECQRAPVFRLGAILWKN